jgi:hypothetical protein
MKSVAICRSHFFVLHKQIHESLQRDDEQNGRNVIHSVRTEMPNEAYLTAPSLPPHRNCPTYKFALNAD